MMDLFDVQAAEKAEAQIDQFISKRAREKREANAVEAAWTESERRVREKRRQTNRQAWIDHYAHMHRLHLSLAAEHADKRSRVLLETKPDQGPEAA
jgi:hypothetical protein